MIDYILPRDTSSTAKVADGFLATSTDLGNGARSAGPAMMEKSNKFASFPLVVLYAGV